MSDNFGLKIGIEGEKDFKQALSDINQSFKVLGSEMNLVASQFDKQDRSIDAITARNQVLNKEIDTQKDKIGALEKALENATSSFGENDRRTKAWAIQLNNANAELNGMERELEQNNKALDKTTNEFDDAEKQADQFGDEVKKSADRADDASSRFNNLSGVLKGIGIAMGTAMVAIGVAAVGAGKALVGMAVSSAAYADEILTQSTVTGMSTEKLQAYKYAAELVDTDLETLTGTMARNIRSMDSASKGTGTVAEAYKELGISVTDAHGNLRDGETVYWEAIDALGKISNETERDALAMALFGKSAQELNPLIAQGSAGMASLTEEAMKMGAVMSGDTLNALGKFDDSVQRLKSGGEAAKNMLGTVLLPQLQVLADSGVSLLGDFTKGLSDAGGDWNKISEVIGNTVGRLSEMLMENLPKLIQVGLDIVTAIGSAIVDNLPVIVDSAVQIITTLLQALIEAQPQITEGALQLLLSLTEGLIENLPLLIDAALQMVLTLATGIANSLPELIPTLVQAVLYICQTLAENIDLLVQAALAIITGLAQGLLAALPVLIAALPTIINSLIDSLLTAIPQIIQAGITLLTALVGALPEIIAAIVAAIPQIIDGVISAVIESLPLIIQAGIDLFLALIKALPDIILAIVGAIPQIIDGITSALIDNLPLIINAGVTLFVALIENLPTIIIEIVKAIPKIVSGIVEAFGGLIGKLVEVGGNLIKGVWKGISDAGAWLWEKISGFFGGIVDSIKSFFGIQSPSTVFAGLGGFMAQGLGVGFENEMRKVSEQMQASIPTGLELNGTYSATARMGEGIVNGLASVLGGATQGGNYTINLVVGGKTLASVLFDPLQAVAKQRGVAFG
jgi:phage-related protein